MTPAVIMDPVQWAQHEFGECELGDVRRNKRLVKFATQAVARPDEGTPDQTETWADLKGAYRLFNCDDITYQALIAPHCRQTREASQSDAVKLILNDTTEMNFTWNRTAQGLGAVGGNEKQKGFHVHSGLMLDATTETIDGLAGQDLYYRPAVGKKQGAKNTRRRDPKREWAVWGRLIEQIGSPPTGVHWIHVCDRAADDYEVMLRAQGQRCGFVIRGSKLNRKVHSLDGRELTLDELPREWVSQGEREINVKAQANQPARKARVELRYGEVLIPQPRIKNAYIRQHAPREPLRLRLVELREVKTNKRVKPIRWLLYTTETICDVAAAERIVRYYELRWTIEDFHKCWKTGCKIEDRRYETAARLERVAATTAIVAVRLLRMRTAAKENPDQLANEVAPQRWVEMISIVRKRKKTSPMTIREFVRSLAGLGGFLGRKGDGEPGWITLWRGQEKLILLLRGAAAFARKCG